MANRSDIKNVIAYLVMAFPNFHPDVTSNINTVDVWFDLLGHLPADALKIACQACCATPGRAFAPSPGEIIGIVAELSAQAAGLPSAGEAWGAVIGSYERMPGGNMSGGGHSPILDNPVVKEAVHQMGGYPSIDYENQMPARAQFLRIYTDCAERAVRDATQLPAVKDYVDQQRLEVGDIIRRLTDKLSHPRLETK